jgi:hypothetical protein
VRPILQIVRREGGAVCARGDIGIQVQEQGSERGAPGTAQFFPTAHFAEEAAHLRYGLVDAVTGVLGGGHLLESVTKRAVLGEKVPHGCQGRLRRGIADVEQSCSNGDGRQFTKVHSPRRLLPHFFWCGQTTPNEHRIP